MINANAKRQGNKQVMAKKEKRKHESNTNFARAQHGIHSRIITISQQINHTHLSDKRHNCHRHIFTLYQRFLFHSVNNTIKKKREEEGKKKEFVRFPYLFKAYIIIF